MSSFSSYGRYAVRRAPTTETISPPAEVRDNTKARRAWLAEKLAEVTAAGRIAKIVGQGSYQSISMKIVKDVEMVPQVRGHCQICGGRWAIVGERISHHGYTRPGDGWQTASCSGARHVPLSVSNGQTLEYRPALIASIERLEAALVATPATISMKVYLGMGKSRYDQIDSTHPQWDDQLFYHRRRIQDNIEAGRDFVKHIDRIIADFDAGKYVGTTREEMVPRV